MIQFRLINSADGKVAFSPSANIIRDYKGGGVVTEVNEAQKGVMSEKKKVENLCSRVHRWGTELNRTEWEEVGNESSETD